MSNDPTVFAVASYLFEVNPILHSSSTGWTSQNVVLVVGLLLDRILR